MKQDDKRTICYDFISPGPSYNWQSMVILSTNTIINKLDTVALVPFGLWWIILNNWLKEWSCDTRLDPIYRGALQCLHKLGKLPQRGKRQARGEILLEDDDVLVRTRPAINSLGALNWWKTSGPHSLKSLIHTCAQTSPSHLSRPLPHATVTTHHS